ncbi:MAG: hypothetical protein ACTSXL_01010 [Alphaproteobacteria bacterium]|nr:MAG: hypothetical protein B6I23_03480 [Rickettsiaceae bacterium 4572_127]
MINLTKEKAISIWKALIKKGQVNPDGTLIDINPPISAENMDEPKKNWMDYLDGNILSIVIAKILGRELKANDFKNMHTTLAQEVYAIVEDKNIVSIQINWKKFASPETNEFKIVAEITPEQMKDILDLQSNGLKFIKNAKSVFAVAKQKDAIIVARKLGFAFSENSNVLEKSVWKKQRSKEGNLYIVGVVAEKDLKGTQQILKTFRIDFSVKEDSGNCKITIEGESAIDFAPIVNHNFSKESMKAYNDFVYKKHTPNNSNIINKGRDPR